MKNKFLLILCLLVILFSCNSYDPQVQTDKTSPILSSGETRFYTPQSEWEQSVYDYSTRDVWPDDIRENIDSYKDVTVAWAGIVEKYFVEEQDEYIILHFYTKHHYYDWIEDFEPDNKPVKLSPSGEGYFLSYFLFNKGTNMDEYTKDLIGDCIISYGRPLSIESDETIQLESDYVRLIPKEYISIWFEYGREGFGAELIK